MVIALIKDQMLENAFKNCSFSKLNQERSATEKIFLREAKFLNTWAIIVTAFMVCFCFIEIFETNGQIYILQQYKNNLLLVFFCKISIAVSNITLTIHVFQGIYCTQTMKYQCYIFMKQIQNIEHKTNFCDDFTNALINSKNYQRQIFLKLRSLICKHNNLKA